ncbi:MAG: hypothetical protein V3V33_13365 [Candidatus Lokiarchaeia archaeon]
MNLEPLFKKINFVDRYQKIYEKYNDFDNRLSTSNKKMYLEKIKIFDRSVIYHSKDKMFQVNFKYKSYSLNLGLSLHHGIVEARLFYIKDEEWLIYNRFDFICEKLLNGFREKYNIPKYRSEEELEDILKEIFSIYEDLKKEFIKQYN